MTDKQIEGLVLQDQEGNCYVISRETIEASRVSGERQTEIAAWFKEQEVVGYTPQQGAIYATAVAYGGLMLGMPGAVMGATAASIYLSGQSGHQASSSSSSGSSSQPSASPTPGKK